MLPGDDADGLRAVTAYNTATGKMGRRLPMKVNGDCAYLGEGGCTIYERRPQVCRLYDCRDHYHKPAAERRRIEASFGPQDFLITARGRQLVENPE